MTAVQLDKYAKDASTWRRSAEITFTASRILFENENPFMCFPAATLGHHALEKYLKAALICSGSTIVEPRLWKELVASGTMNADGAAWGHNLVELAGLLAERQPAFDLSRIILDGYIFQEMPMTLKAGLAMFDPFFSELRYPQEMEKLDSVGPSDIIVLEAIVGAIVPFTSGTGKTVRSRFGSDAFQPS